ncbi:TetR family transcriptional regulator [Cryobacterium sp. MLB-32]|uniref:TetR/AcrR family transcriptional regulator n=1 Tax=Cryobacterium sp. MLB-32 TaxID=1529318 RepID=UPI0004E7A805|nr:TetR/AcrR family transcriptional regulator [Cryobacterium sp. MLB-32]KFF60446.1 TetR family transcriptional regulator [Cryobacterium sp. MLB-32]
MVQLTDTVARPATHAKVRILATADRLFYAEGVHTVGVDRIISESKVTKATFYKYYRSKDALIVVYLEGRDRIARDFLASIDKRYDTPEQRLRGIVAEISTQVTRQGFHGCPFINAAAQFADPSHPVRQAVTTHREWYGAALEDLFRGMGHARPGDAADDFFLARDGAFAGANLGDPIGAHTALLRAVQRVLDETAG